MSQIDDLHAEADLCRNEGADDIARMLDRAANTIESLARMCKQVEWVAEDVIMHKWCPLCHGYNYAEGHKPDCPWITNGVAALLGEETE